MNPKYQRYADRLRELIEEGKKLSLQQDQHERYIKDNVAVNQFVVKVENIVASVFRRDSAHFERLKRTTKGHVQHNWEVDIVVGVLAGALDDLENGYLIGQEHLIAGGIFDSVLEEAKHLREHGHKDPAAILGRVVLEDCLRRLCREEGLDDSAKAAAMNEALRQKGRYAQPRWRQIQAWLDIGNSAAHGEFDKYTADEVERLLDGIGGLLAQELKP